MAESADLHTPLILSHTSMDRTSDTAEADRFVDTFPLALALMTDQAPLNRFQGGKGLRREDVPLSHDMRHVHSRPPCHCLHFAIGTPPATTRNQLIFIFVDHRH